MPNTVKINIDDQEYAVPAGANLVDLAKQRADNAIPVFCYHPKLEPAGMCRLCLVEMGAIQKDRTTGQTLLDNNGQPQIRWNPKLQTACTQTVSEGLVIRTNTPQVQTARKNMIEFLLTSHPLDCPTCDKGGECPLQNLTLAYGPGISRMYFDDKLKLGKHIPLGDLICLDQERCIQCARCVRFQEEVVGDAVLAFHRRGRNLQIITHSQPGFKSYFSGNTTDICPVGALTTTDFRFGARPWELTPVPSICPYDAAGTNITLCMRADSAAGGQMVIKRILPRQNEYVNEIWISDKTRFGHHFTHSADRLQKPLIRDAESSLTHAEWSDALQATVNALKDAGKDIAAIAGSGMSNEDLWELRKLVEGLGGKRLGAWPPTHAGADIVAQVGVGKGTNLGQLGAGDAVLVIACDLEEEVPIWRLRIKQAHDRGAYLVVANARHTRLADFADAMIEYKPGQAAHTLRDIETEQPEIAPKLGAANHLIIVAGAEGLTLDGSRALMQAAMNFLVKTKHVGKPNNGLLSPFPGPNGMGLHYLGYTPEVTFDIAQHPPKVLIVAQAELLADDPTADEWLKQVQTVICLSLFPDATTKFAETALPIQSFAERDGTFTNGERRVQRFYLAQGPMGEALPAWQICTRLGEQLGLGRAKFSAAAVMNEIAQQVPELAGISYPELAQVGEPQFPPVGGKNCYYSGAVTPNRGGLGLQIATEADNGKTFRSRKVELPAVIAPKRGQVVIIPTTRLYNRQSVLLPSTLLQARILPPYVEINLEDAAKKGIAPGDCVEVTIDATTLRAVAYVNGGAPKGAVILPRHLAEVGAPMTITVGKISKIGN